MSDPKATGRPPFRAVLKTFLAIFLSLELCLAIFFLSFYFLDMRATQALLAKSESSHVELQKRIISFEFKEIVTDLLFLAEDRSLIDFLDYGGESRRQDLARLFLRFCDQQEIFDQVRYLDDSGKEVVRVNLSTAAPPSFPRPSCSRRPRGIIFWMPFVWPGGRYSSHPLT